MTRDELEAMTKDQLREHAAVQGVTLLALDSKGTMVDKILGDYVAPAKAVVQTGPDEKLPAQGKLRTLDGKLVNAPLYDVEIFATESDKSDVDLVCNGHNLRIKRGEKVRIMEPYVEILRNAVVETVEQDPDTGVRTSARRMVYPHSAVRVG